MAHDAATSPPAIALGTYADLLGRTWLQDDKALTQELAKRNLGPDDWVNARAFWTKAIDEDAARGGKELALPFAGSAEPARVPAPDLTLPHYASLCVELVPARSEPGVGRTRRPPAGASGEGFA